MEALQSGTSLGGLLNTSRSKVNDCQLGVQSAISEAEGWLGRVRNNQCYDDNGGQTVRGIDGYVLDGSGVIYKSNFGESVVRKRLKSSSGCVSEQKIKDYIDDLQSAQDRICSKTDKASVGGRIVTDLLGAATLGTAGYLAVSTNVKAANLRQFTEDEQEFMRNVGNHIYCFIGADEAGTYGDLIEISVE
jgi:hypothetical protein